MNRAMAARAPRAACPGIAQRAALLCASDGYEAARRGDASPALAAAHAQALICAGHLSEPDSAARLGRAALAAAAAAPADRALLLRSRAQALITGAHAP